MKRYLLDTNIVSALIKKHTLVCERAEQARRAGIKIGIGIPVLAELYYGAEFSQARAENLQRLRRGIAGLIVWPFNEEAAAEFGRLRAETRRIGRQMQTIDLMIAAIAIALGDTVLVTADRDYLAATGLRNENWLV